MRKSLVVAAIAALAIVLCALPALAQEAKPVAPPAKTLPNYEFRQADGAHLFLYRDGQYVGTHCCDTGKFYALAIDGTLVPCPCPAPVPASAMPTPAATTTTFQTYQIGGSASGCSGGSCGQQQQSSGRVGILGRRRQ